MRGLGLAALLAGCGQPQLRVELLEDDAAQVVELPSGLPRTVPRALLPPSVREGDVLTNGAPDPQARLELERAVRSARTRAFPRRRTGALTFPKEQ